MSKSKNGAIVGQILKGVFTFAIAIFAAKQTSNKFKEHKNKK